jgi:hypothetical protein
MNSQNSVITLTFGDSAENHVGMEKIGTMVSEGEGFSVAELERLQEKLNTLPRVYCDLYRLNEVDQPDAAVLVLRNGVNAILRMKRFCEADLFAEQAALEVDKKAFMYGRVVNKNARWNLCFDDVGHEPDYEAGKGRIVPYESIPCTKFLRESLFQFFGPKAKGLKCEANYYYDVKKCGIGFHGDSERRKVVGVRLGAAMDMHFRWFKDGQPVGEEICVPLYGGDIYIMSEKAVGTDWKKRSIYTLRHATGCSKFTTV